MTGPDDAPFADAPLPEQTDNGPRPDDGPQPEHVDAPGVVDGVQTLDEEADK